MAKKGRKKSGLRIVLPLLLLAVGAAAFFMYRRGHNFALEQEMAGKSYVETAVTRGTIRETITGSGTLSRDDPEDVVIPTGYTIDRILVDTGDTVAQGQALATVELNSLRTAIADIQSSIATIDEELGDIGDESEDKTVRSPISGRVKAIYIRSGEEAGEIVRARGALMLLSMDGLMQVSLPGNASVRPGESCTVTADGGVQYEGTAASSTVEALVVTIPDEEALPGTAVQVTRTADGAALGSGELQVHAPWQVTEMSGTAGEIYVSVNEKVSSDSRLLKLTGVKDTAKQEELLAKRADLAEALATMLAIETDGVIRSDRAGTVTAVLVSEGETVTKSSGAVQGSLQDQASGAGAYAQAYSLTAASSGDRRPVSAASMASSGGSRPSGRKGGPLLLLADEAGAEEAGTILPAGGTDGGTVTSAGTGDGGTETSADTGGGEGGPAPEVTQAPAAETVPIAIGSVAIPLRQPEADSQMSKEELAAAFDSDAAYIDGLSWNMSGGSGEAVVVIRARGGFVFPSDVQVRSGGGAVASQSVEDGGSRLVVRVNCPVAVPGDGTGASEQPASEQNASEQNASEQNTSEQNTSDAGAVSAGPTPSPLPSGVPGDVTVPSGITVPDTGSTADTTGTGTFSIPSGVDSSAYSSYSLPGSISIGSLGSGAYSGYSLSQGTGDLSGLGTQAGAAAGAASLYSAYETPGFQVAPDSDMKLVINIDELDILSVSEGQSAEVELDAMDGELFTGTVTSVSREGVNTGGSTKYAVTLMLARDERMLPGMSATASVTVREAENVLTLPADALGEDAEGAYVFTSVGEDGKLSGKKHVKTGLATENRVEITEGVEEGETVRYEELPGDDIMENLFEYGNMGGMRDRDA